MVTPRFLLLLAAMLLALPASAKEVVITSEPSAAEVFVDGRLLGRTPLTTRKAELLPNWTTDGRITKATIVIRKAGYEDFRVFIGEFSVPSRVEAKLKLIASTENLESYLESNSALEAMTIAASESVIRTSHDLDAASQELYSQGYLLVGYAGYVAETVISEQLRASATKLGASLVLIIRNTSANASPYARSLLAAEVHLRPQVCSRQAWQGQSPPSPSLQDRLKHTSFPSPSGSFVTRRCSGARESRTHWACSLTICRSRFEESCNGTRAHW